MSEVSSLNSIVFFDGVCNLCNGAVNFLIKNDHARLLRYASLQGKTALKMVPEEAKNLDSIVFFHKGHYYKKSQAALLICDLLGGPWKLIAKIFSIIPKDVLDKIYDFISKNRYAIFGKQEVCRLPSEEEKGLFLD